MKNVDKLKIILMGLIIGILCGMFSAGGGLIAIPFFTSVMNFDEKKARIGGFIGSKMLQKVNNKVLTVIFIAFLIFTGVRLLIQK